MWFTRYIQKCTLSHVLMLIMTCSSWHPLINQCMVKNTKTWISSERNITFLWNKKILNLCLRWHILRSHRFAAEVTLKDIKHWNACVHIPWFSCELQHNLCCPLIWILNLFEILDLPPFPIKSLLQMASFITTQNKLLDKP